MSFKFTHFWFWPLKVIIKVFFTVMMDTVLRQPNTAWGFTAEAATLQQCTSSFYFERHRPWAWTVRKYILHKHKLLSVPSLCLSHLWSIISALASLRRRPPLRCYLMSTTSSHFLFVWTSDFQLWFSFMNCFINNKRSPCDLVNMTHCRISLTSYSEDVDRLSDRNNTFTLFRTQMAEH